MLITPIPQNRRVILFPRTPSGYSNPQALYQARTDVKSRVFSLLTSARNFREGYFRASSPVPLPNLSKKPPAPINRPKGLTHPYSETSFSSKEAPGEARELTELEKTNYRENYDRALHTAHSVRRRYGLGENSDPEIEEAAIKSLDRAVRNYNPHNEHGASFTTYLHSGLFPDVKKACFKILKRQGKDIEDIDSLPAKGQSVEDAVADNQLRRILEREVKRLPPRTANIVRRHTGLGEEAKESLKTIAEDLNMHEVSVRRLFGQGLQKLREALADQGVEVFISSMYGSNLEGSKAILSSLTRH